MRKATLIHQDWLRSKTMALAGDTIENIAFRLLVISDDFGRFPDDPEGLRVMMNDIRHNPEMIADTIKYLVDKHTVERYEADGQTICHWTRWDDYQNIRWVDDAKYPNNEGLYEVSNNPQTIAKRNDKQAVKRVVKRNGQQSESEEEKEKEKEEELSPRFLEASKELFPEMKLPQVKAGALILEEIERLDGKPLDDLMPALRWAIQDTGDGSWPGWSKNFLACAGLRKRKNGAADLMKWEKIFNAYEKEYDPDDPNRPGNVDFF